MAKAPCRHEQGGVDLERRSSARDLNSRSCTSACARSSARPPQGTPPPTRGKVRGGGASRGARRAPAVPARARSARRIWTGGGTVFGPRSAPLHRQGQSQGPPCRAAQRAVAARRPWLDRRGRRAGVRRAVVPGRGRRRRLAKWGGEQPVVCGHWARTRWRPSKSFRNLDRVAVVPADALGVADVVGAASLVVSELGAGRAHRVGRREGEPAEADAEGGQRLMDARR